MNPNKTYYGDWRLNNCCAYCGSFAETEDHVPSQCFLDKPHPQNMPVVPCCKQCNRDFSEDEEYVSCMIDCMKAQTAIPTKIQREKTRKSLLHSQKLQERIAAQIREFGGQTIFNYEKERFENIIHKLAFGHLTYENDRLAWDSTYSYTMWLLPNMPDSQKRSFLEPYAGTMLPEVGSHSLNLSHVMLACGDDARLSTCSFWNTVQENRYSYCVSPDSDRVKFIIANFFAVEVQII